MASQPSGRQDPHFAGVDQLSSTLLGALADGVFIAREYHFIWGNEAIASMLGYTPETFAGLPFAAVIDPVFLPRWTERFARRITGVAPEPPRHYELQVRRRDSSAPLWVELRARRIFLGDDPAILGVLRDITERKSSEATMRALDLEVRASQKMEAMGRLASAVAHDFNNLLQIIRSSAELLRSAGPGAPSFTTDLDAMLQAVDRAAALTTPLLAFGRHQHATLELVAPCSRVRAVVAASEALVPMCGVEFHLHCDPGAETLRIHADPGQFDEVVRQLLRNAAEAMPGGGAVEVHLTRELITEPILHRHGIVPSGDFLRLSVSDVGHGMSDEVMERLFEPFFTTKEQGTGPGLGLAVVYGVVRAGGGSVTVRSVEGTGSTVTVFWPCTSDAAMLPNATSPLASPAGKPSGVTEAAVAESNADESSAAQAVESPTPLTRRPADRGGAQGGAAVSIAYATQPSSPFDPDERLLADGTLRPSPRPAIPVGGSGPLLLVVDDEDGVRRTVTRMLERTGYRIIGASNGREGLAVLQDLAAEGTTVHGVVTDVRMPQLGGVEMVTAMMGRGWYLPVLFVSGQLDAPLPESWPTAVPRRFLRKPFTLTELQAEVAALLATSPAAGT